ncbi:FAD-dependent oxidoreductase [Arthrobacter sp. AQ5-05]|uniref:FAD-dependent oxidoreductase n=1 Tax=Arthrobacter sp. AQ5-05 TaxID=2184581 RepID=UPI001C661306|nr:FAD-dependent oxidoreductase [Arthrobacter sp. AQ5-05]
MSTQVLVLGTGFGGLEVAAGLSERFGAGIEVMLIDRNGHFMFGFSKLAVMFGRPTLAEASHPCSQLDKPGVKHVRATILSIDPAAKSVETDSGTCEADYLVVALGADLDPSATPGLLECGNEYYSVAGALAAREALNDFDGGQAVIAVTSTPFKCPPAPSKTAFLVHDRWSPGDCGNAPKSPWSCRCALPCRRCRRPPRRCSRPLPSAASRGIPGR